MYADKKLVAHQLYEGEYPNMSQQTQDNLKALLGDGNAKITCSRQVSESSYGNGGQVFVSVQLTCDQSEAMVRSAAQWAAHLAESFAFEQLPELRKKLVDAGIIKP